MGWALCEKPTGSGAFAGPMYTVNLLQKVVQICVNSGVFVAQGLEPQPVGSDAAFSDSPDKNEVLKECSVSLDTLNSQLAEARHPTYALNPDQVATCVADA